MSDDEITGGQWLNQRYHEDALKKRGSYFSVAQWSMEKFGIGAAAMSNYMNDKRKPTGDNLDSLLAHYGLEVFPRFKIRMPEGIDLDVIRAKVAIKKARPETKKRIMDLINSVLDSDEWKAN